MAKRKTTTTEEQPRPVLVIPKEHASDQIEDQLIKGRRIQEAQITNQQQLEEMRTKKTKWVRFTTELLSRLFSNDSIAEEFSTANRRAFAFSGYPTLQDDIESLMTDMKYYMTSLESIHERLALIPEDVPKAVEVPVPQESQKVTVKSRMIDPNKVFVVHGHDDTTKITVARFLEKLGLEPIILHEQANQGGTVIEKIERYSNVGFAVVLLTPDDEGHVKGQLEQKQPRARQNVILELGYFIGLLGREKVAALVSGGVELPSDFSGIVYTSLNGNWQFDLAKELRAAGIKFDAEKMF
jgi:predicted nucleotide-binding protein